MSKCAPNPKAACKTALITGCEGQIGRQFVARLKALGYRVVGFDIAEQTGQADIIYRRVDITKAGEISLGLDGLDNVDVLVNNAGVAVFTPFEDRTPEELDYVFGVNLKGTILMTQAVYKRFFKPNRRGCVVNIGSIYGVVAGDMRLYNPGDRRTSEIYGATKAAVIQLTRYFSAYMAPDHVRVNCISPGGVFNHQSPDFVRKYSAKVPAGRMADEQELLSTLEYLMSEESGYVTGQNIVVDGGFSAW